MAVCVVPSLAEVATLFIWNGPPVAPDGRIAFKTTLYCVPTPPTRPATGPVSGIELLLVSKSGDTPSGLNNWKVVPAGNAPLEGDTSVMSKVSEPVPLLVKMLSKDAVPP